MEKTARAIKAIKLVAAIGGLAARWNATALQIAKLADDNDWRAIAKVAGVNEPSEQTKALVLESLESADRILTQVQPERHIGYCAFWRGGECDCLVAVRS